MADRNIQVIFNLRVVLESWDWIFLGIKTSFQKSNIDWPHQPLTEKLPVLVNNWVLMIYSTRTGIGHSGARDDQTIRISRFFDEMRLSRSLRPLRLLRLQRSLRLQKAWKITTDDCSVIQVPKFSFILMFWKQIFFVRIMKYQVEFWHLLSWRLLRPAYVNFLKTGGWNSNVQISWMCWAP